MSKRTVSLLHLLVLATLVLFNNCTGFSSRDLAQLNNSSSLPSEPPNVPAGAPTPGPIAPPTPGATMKQVFMASGDMARTLMSCDDGQTWINDRSDDDAARCNVAGDPNYVECTHDSHTAISIDAGDGYFFTDYGWGHPGTVRMSRDGWHWQIIKSGSAGGGVFYALNRLWLLWDQWYLSSDLGQTWTNVVNPPQGTVTTEPIGHRLGTKFIAAGRQNGISVSWDQGQTWQVPAGFDSRWANSAAEGNGVLVTVGSTWDQTNGSTNYSARSTDGGHTWTGGVIEANSQYGEWQNVVFDGRSFAAFGVGTTWKSTDGITWTPSAISYSSGRVSWGRWGTISVNPATGTYVKISYDNYANQIAARSTDGIFWNILDSTHFKGGHPVNVITVGDMEAKYCP